MTDPKNPSPKHGSSSQENVDAIQKQPSVSQADGTAANAPRGETQAQPDQAKDPQVKSETPENREGKINPSAPNDAHTPKEGTSKMPANTTRDSAGEVGEPTGEGNLDAPKLDAPKQDEHPSQDDQGVKKEEEAA